MPFLSTHALINTHNMGGYSRLKNISFLSLSRMGYYV